MVFWLICSLYIFKKNVYHLRVDTARFLNELTFPISITFHPNFVGPIDISQKFDTNSLHKIVFLYQNTK